MVYDSNRSMVRIVLFALCSLMIPASRADEVSCQPQKYDPEFPAALLGKYEIIGRMPDSGVTYGGTLEIKGGKKAYALKRTVNGNTMAGEAWIETCGSNDFRMLSFRYTEGKRPLEGYCFMQSNLENEMLLSCYTNFAGKKNERPGLESMFPHSD